MVQDGSLNSTILSAMGLSIDNNGRVYNNAFYIKYLNIANFYNKPMSFEEISSDTTNILPKRQYIFDSNVTVSDNQYYIDNNKEDKTYNHWKMMK